MNAVHAMVPRPLAVMLSTRLAAEVARARALAEQRLAARSRWAEEDARELQWLQRKADLHVRDRPRCCWGSECHELKCLKREIKGTEHRYQRSLKRLRRGK